jgi:hypothetical protein
MISRRAFVRTTIAGTGGVLLGSKPAGLKIGVMDTVFRMAGKPEAVGLARMLGLAGVQVTLGRSTDSKTLPLEDASTQAAWRAASREHDVPLDSTYLDMLHADCLKDNSNAPMWIRKGIEITKRLNAPGWSSDLRTPAPDRTIATRSTK